MKFRLHRGGLEESMETMVELVGFAQLVAHCRAQYGDLVSDFPDDAFKTEKVMGALDERTGWEETHYVKVEGLEAVLGMTDQSSSP